MYTKLPLKVLLLPISCKHSLLLSDFSPVLVKIVVAYIFSYPHKLKWYIVGFLFYFIFIILFFSFIFQWGYIVIFTTYDFLNEVFIMTSWKRWWSSFISKDISRFLKIFKSSIFMYNKETATWCYFIFERFTLSFAFLLI